MLGNDSEVDTCARGVPCLLLTLSGTRIARGRLIWDGQTPEMRVRDVDPPSGPADRRPSYPLRSGGI